jgi:hypothetical protein
MTILHDNQLQGRGQNNILTRNKLQNPGAWSLLMQGQMFIIMTCYYNHYVYCQ